MKGVHRRGRKRKDMDEEEGNRRKRNIEQGRKIRGTKSKVEEPRGMKE